MKCWSSEPSQRPTLDEILFVLDKLSKNDTIGFITNCIVDDDCPLSYSSDKMKSLKIENNKPMNIFKGEFKNNSDDSFASKKQETINNNVKKFKKFKFKFW